MQFSAQQLQVIESDYGKSIFLSGPAGTGKTSAGVERLKYIVDSGIPGNNVLLLFHQRTLGMEMYDKWEFIDKISVPSRNLRQIEILDTEYSQDQIVIMRFTQQKKEDEI